jgi:hypothetical protein
MIRKRLIAKGAMDAQRPAGNVHSVRAYECGAAGGIARLKRAQRAQRG